MKNNMVMSSWSENPYNNESNQPWYQGQASNLKSSCDSLGISQLTSIECDFVVIIKLFIVPFSYLESFIVQYNNSFPLDWTHQHSHSFDSGLYLLILYFQVGEEHFGQIWIYVTSQAKESFQPLKL